MSARRTRTGSPGSTVITTDTGAWASPAARAVLPASRTACAVAAALSDASCSSCAAVSSTTRRSPPRTRSTTMRGE